MGGRRADHASTFEQTGCSPGQFYLYPPSPRLSIGMTGSVPLDCVMFGGCLSALGSCTQNAVSGFVRFREGFRMPARRLTCAAEPRACVRKPPKKEPAGTGERFAVYGDLIGQRFGREMRWQASLRADWRWRLRIGRWCCARQLDLETVRGVASEFAVAVRTVARGRERGCSGEGMAQRSGG
jgi:hypothetical protein